MNHLTHKYRLLLEGALNDVAMKENVKLGRIALPAPPPKFGGAPNGI
jgi:hypothetical protein